MNSSAVFVDTVLRTDTFRVDEYDTMTHDRTKIIFDLRLGNISGTSSQFDKAIVRWSYRRGHLASIGFSDIFEPTADINIDLPLDVDAWTGERPEFLVHEVQIDPFLSVPVGSEADPGYTNVQVQMHYSFVGQIDCHPESDWDILFDLTLRGVDSPALKVIPTTSWQYPDRVNPAPPG